MDWSFNFCLMKKAITFRLSPELIEQAREAAKADYRSLTSFVEKAISDAIKKTNASKKKQGIPFVMRSCRTEAQAWPSS